jgi:hypothetical protein
MNNWLMVYAFEDIDLNVLGDTLTPLPREQQLMEERRPPSLVYLNVVIATA